MPGRRQATNYSTPGRTTMSGARILVVDQVPAPDRELSAREILDRRYARGEINREEYDLMKETISN